MTKGRIVVQALLKRDICVGDLPWCLLNFCLFEVLLTVLQTLSLVLGLRQAKRMLLDSIGPWDIEPS